MHGLEARSKHINSHATLQENINRPVNQVMLALYGLLSKRQLARTNSHLTENARWDHGEEQIALFKNRISRCSSAMMVLKPLSTPSPIDQ